MLFMFIPLKITFVVFELVIDCTVDMFQGLLICFVHMITQDSSLEQLRNGIIESTVAKIFSRVSTMKLVTLRFLLPYDYMLRKDPCSSAVYRCLFVCNLQKIRFLILTFNPSSLKSLVRILRTTQWKTLIISTAIICSRWSAS